LVGKKREGSRIRTQREAASVKVIMHQLQSKRIAKEDQPYKGS